MLGYACSYGAVGGALGKDREELVEVLRFTMPLYVPSSHLLTSLSCCVKIED